MSLFLRRRAFVFLLFALAGCGMFAQKGSQTAALLYKGTVGQQHVTVWLDIEGESLRGGHYAYDGQASEIQFTEARVFGTTAVLQDEDGNTLHLHMKSASGGGAPEWANAAALEGTLVRGEMELPVKLARVSGK